MLKELTLASGAVFLAYCVYFDWKRHRDPDLKKKLIEKRKKSCKLSIRRRFEMPEFKSIEEKQRFMMEKFEEGDALVNSGELSEAVDAYSMALYVSDGSPQLMEMFRALFAPEFFNAVLRNYRELSNSQVE